MEDPRIGRVVKHSTGSEVIPWQLFESHILTMSLASSRPLIFALLCTELTQVPRPLPQAAHLLLRPCSVALSYVLPLFPLI